MALNKSYNGTPFNATGTGSTVASATKTGVAGSTYYITDIAAVSDKAGAILLVKNGSTTIWQLTIGATWAQHSFASPLQCTAGSDATVTIDGTTACAANIAGYTI